MEKELKELWRDYPLVLEYLNQLCTPGTVRFRPPLTRNHYLQVAKIAREYAGRGMDALDLLQEGNEALEKAGRSWDPDSGEDFERYADRHIRRGLGTALRNNTCLLRLPEDLPPLPEPDIQELPEENPEPAMELLEYVTEREAQVLRLRLGLSGGEPLTLEQTAERFGITTQRVRQIERKALRRFRAGKRRRERGYRDFYC